MAENKPEVGMQNDGQLYWNELTRPETGFYSHPLVLALNRSANSVTDFWEEVVRINHYFLVNSRNIPGQIGAEVVYAFAKGYRDLFGGPAKTIAKLTGGRRVLLHPEQTYPSK